MSGHRRVQMMRTTRARGEDAAPQDQASGTEGSADERAQQDETRASDGDWNRDKDLQDEPGAATVERLSVAVGGNNVGQTVTRLGAVMQRLAGPE